MQDRLSHHEPKIKSGTVGSLNTQLLQWMPLQHRHRPLDCCDCLVRLALGLSYSGGGKPFLTWVMRRAISIDDENAWGGIFIKIIFIKVSLCLCITNQPSNKGYPDFKFLYESGFWPVLNLINEEGCWNNRMVSPWNGPTEMIIYVSP